MRYEVDLDFRLLDAAAVTSNVSEGADYNHIVWVAASATTQDV